MDITRNAAGALDPARLANYLRTLALIPGSFSPASVTVLLQAAADRIDPVPAAATWDDMARQARDLAESMRGLCTYGAVPADDVVTALADLAEQAAASFRHAAALAIAGRTG
jgi:hypothetical protein